MELYTLNAMTKGWFVGSFVPSVRSTMEFEVACKRYQKGEREDLHIHKVATEITLIVSGTVRMMGKIFKKDDIIVLKPGEACDFRALTDATTVVVKYPSIAGDKYPVGSVLD